VNGRGEIIVIGAGIAGASAAAELASTHRVILLERESMPGYHSTGRSAALFSEIYGGPAVRALSRASRDFFFAPPQGFAESPLVKRRGALYIANAEQIPALDSFLANPDVQSGVERIAPEKALAACPILRPDLLRASLFEPAASDVDVNALHMGYLTQFKRLGGMLVTDAELQALDQGRGHWTARTSAGEFVAPVVVNAAGAWADDVAAKAGAAMQSVQPCRRTAVLIELDDGLDPRDWPMTIDIEETFYFKPDAGLLLISPADEAPVVACDVQPDEFDVAVAIHRVQSVTTLKIGRIRRKWAGLRSFAPDREPVIGFDPTRSGFFWLAGQGGYGIQTAPAAATLSAALIRGEELPASLRGFDPALVSPARSRVENKVAASA
jgi:D-arginine dehydrogenase